jgi:hypothetical protein
MPSEIWSDSLSGCPMLTDSLVNRYLPDATSELLGCGREIIVRCPRVAAKP